jgi:N-acetylmuramoyl-L-alanine amidase
MRALLPALLLVPALASARPVVVVDPGHGGSNTGAYGPELGKHEKELTLSLARRVTSYLAQWLPGASVLLTRERDEYLTLASRAERANRARADLFLSLHLNASTGRDRTGFEVFFLDREAHEREAASVRAGGAAVSAILADLRHAAAHGESAELARAVQRALREVRGRDRDRGVRQAPFDVLAGLRMPGVLVEVGYIDHPLEGRELDRPAVREAIAAAVASAVVTHLAGRSEARLASRR